MTTCTVWHSRCQAENRSFSISQAARRTYTAVRSRSRPAIMVSTRRPLGQGWARGNSSRTPGGSSVLSRCARLYRLRCRGGSSLDLEITRKAELCFSTPPPPHGHERELAPRGRGSFLDLCINHTETTMVLVRPDIATLPGPYYLPPTDTCLEFPEQRERSGPGRQRGHRRVVHGENDDLLIARGWRGRRGGEIVAKHSLVTTRPLRWTAAGHPHGPGSNFRQ